MLTWLQKLIAMLLSVTALFTNAFQISWGDSMKGHDFPLIAAEEKAAGDIRVMSFNVRCEDNNGVPRISRKHLAVKEILRIRPDSLGVQEATPEWMSYLDSALPEYGSVGAARDNGRSVFRLGESSAIFYRKDALALLDHGDFWLSETPDKPSIYPGAGCNRICTWALLREKATGVTYLHVNSHFDNLSYEARTYGANLISNWIKENYPRMPVVFTADMNSSELSDAYRIMTEALRDTRYTAADAEAYGTFHMCAPESAENRVLDYILCSPEIDANAYRTVTDGIEGRFVSDHFPIYADLSIPMADTYKMHDFPLIAPEAKAEGDVRVMSYNIRCADVYGVEVARRLGIGTQQIVEIMPDSVGIQECTPEWMVFLKAELPEYGWVGLERENGQPADKGGESCPIFYNKLVFDLVDHGDFWLSATPDVPSLGEGAACKRICTWAVLKNRATGQTYVHVNTHFDHISAEARAFGAEQVMKFIRSRFSDMKVVFTADMNDRVGSAPYIVMTEDLTDARDAAADCISYGTYHGCAPEGHADDVIDFVLCSEGIKVNTYRAVTVGLEGRFVSDHFPIYADLSF